MGKKYSIAKDVIPIVLNDMKLNYLLSEYLCTKALVISISKISKEMVFIIKYFSVQKTTVTSYSQYYIIIHVYVIPFIFTCILS